MAAVVAALHLFGFGILFFVIAPQNAVTIGIA
jgi:hypothetical protein